MNASQCFRFVKVEEFFDNYSKWPTVQNVSSCSFDEAEKYIALDLKKADGQICTMYVQFPREDTFRLRFNPGKKGIGAYTSLNTRSIVMDSFKDLTGSMKDFTLSVKQNSDADLTAWLKDNNGNPVMKLHFGFAPFSMSIYGYEGNEEFQIISAASPVFYYQETGCDGEYSIIHTVSKPATAKYIGFGEHGGVDISKNTSQITYFNFDNMRYRQVYNRGPLEDREPMYSSEPFFMEFYGVPGKDSVYGVFIDNPSETLVDIGCTNSSRYMFGSRFGDLDYYFFMGKKCPDIIDAFTSLVGKSKLKPRYVLGYHQGCYGYENREMLENAANNYRKYQIPIDGLHVDVDIQKNYKTFTIDQDKFNNPKEMFNKLKEKGFKCSTNITPIISNRDPHNSGNPENPDYDTYLEGIKEGYFVNDVRFDAANPDARLYQDYQCGYNAIYPCYDPENNFNSGNPYIGEVYYGGDRGTTGHYTDFGKKDAREWWGRQYQYLFDTGLEMVWQDMTTPCIRNSRGDMRSFPARIMLTNDYVKAYSQDNGSDSPYEKTAAIKMWNFYSYNLHKATYHGLNNLKGRENKRNFIIGRGCFAGMHRFAGLWTGDNSSDWDFLKINISQVLSLGLTGQAVAGEDIGGFERATDWEQWADPELLIRWTVMGAFLPWFRNHYIAKNNKKFQEPYAYQRVDLSTIPEEARYLYPCVLPVCKYYIELRYRLLQLFYDAMFENTLNGMPICRAMIVTDDDKALYNDKIQFLNNQFFVRNDLLIAPVIDKQSSQNGFGKRDIYLPAGSRWYQFMDNKKPLLQPADGGTTIKDYDAHIEGSSEHMPFILPIYVREGAVIPTLELEQYVGELNKRGLPNPITINIYPGQKGEYTMYLDDGISRSSAPAGDPSQGADPAAKSQYRETLITHSTNGKTRQITVKRVFDGYTPEYEKYFYVAVLHDPTETMGQSGCIESIKINDADLPIISGGTPEYRAYLLKNSDDDAWYFNENIRVSFIKVFDNNPSINIIMKLN